MILQMSNDDIQEVCMLEEEIFENEPRKKEYFEYEINENDLSRMFVLKEKNEIIAYGGLWFLFENADIILVGVNPKYQGKGYGQKMLDHLLKVAKDNECEFVHLEVRVSNVKAINLYKKNGFEIIRTRNGYYSDNNEDAYDMMKGLL